QRQVAMLDEGERLIARREDNQASALVQKVLTETKNSNVLDRATAMLVRTHPTFPREILDHLSPVGWILFDVILALVVVGLFYSGLLAIRGISAYWHRKKWLMFEIEDRTNASVGAMMVELLKRWSQDRRPVSAGLLRLEALQIPTVPFDLPIAHFDWAIALDAIPTIHGISPAAIGKVIGPVRKWFN